MCTFGIKNWDPIECQVKGDAWEKYGKERKQRAMGIPHLCWHSKFEMLKLQIQIETLTNVLTYNMESVGKWTHSETSQLFETLGKYLKMINNQGFLAWEQIISGNCWKYFCVCHNKSPLVEFTNSGSNSEPNILLLPSCWIQNISKFIKPRKNNKICSEKLHLDKLSPGLNNLLSIFLSMTYKNKCHPKESLNQFWWFFSRLPCHVFFLCMSTNKNPNANKLSWVIN